jgi:hypothetical protein
MSTPSGFYLRQARYPRVVILENIEWLSCQGVGSPFNLDGCAGRDPAVWSGLGAFRAHYATSRGEVTA